ncbi:MAG: UDP-3-O-(3-hydroxymyristoyl)glucosamine N-acyltransferase [Gemmatimonadota bacterium]|nr:UDP-3-O-(3-hydroxymyristoyl)glucosamine N-acyltransferase [Gemmatimonadota bacterium]
MRTWTLGELAEAVDARLEGNPDAVIHGVARLEDAGPQELSFLANPKYRRAALRSGAGALVVGEAYPADGQNVLRSDNPYLTFARATELIDPAPEPVPGVAATAVVAPSATVPDDASIGEHVVIGADARLGEGVAVGSGSVLEAGVEIGAGTRIHPRVTVHAGTTIGRDCVIQSGAVLGSAGFGYATDEVGRHHRVPQRGGLLIGDEVDVGANVTIDRGSAGNTVIGDGTKIDNLVQVGHNVAIGRGAFIVAQAGIAGSSKIGDHAVLGGQAGITGHVTIGAGARIGGQAGVIGDVPEGEEFSGYPARPHREQLRAHALFARLPELFDRLKALEGAPRESRSAESATDDPEPR